MNNQENTCMNEPGDFASWNWKISSGYNESETSMEDFGNCHI